MTRLSIRAVALAAVLLMPSIDAQQVRLSIVTVHESASELETRAQLERLMSQYKLVPWQFTNQVVIDDRAIPHSHPILTLHTRHLHQDDQLLSTYLHEQLHWYFSAHEPETEAAEHDLMKLFPDAPVGYPDGGEDLESTYLHLLVCFEEEQADIALLGPQRAKQTMEFWAGDHYRWIYRTVLVSGSKIEAVLKAHKLSDPARLG